MDNLVYFNVQKEHNFNTIDLLCVYLPDSVIKDVTDFYSALSFALTRCDTLPDGIVMFHNKLLSEDITLAWGDDIARGLLYDRCSKNNILYAKNFHFVSMSSNGLELNKSLDATEFFYDIEIDDLHRFYISGIGKLSEKNDVIHQAPAGHNFKHPSGNILKLFLQAKEIACNEAELQFVGRGLFLLNAHLNWSEVKVVHIDSMGIFSLVKEAIIFSNSNAQIENFHSYEGVYKLTTPEINEIAIISASTSGSMAVILNEKGFKSNNVITLIDVKARKDFCHTLLVIEDDHNIIHEESANYNYETEIELVGEQFSFKAKPPKQITISIQHRPPTLKDILKTFGLSGVNRVNEQLGPINKTPLISLKPENLLSCSMFNKWLKEELKWSLPSSVNTILYKDDGASQQLAESIKDVILSIRGENSVIKIIEATALDSEKLNDCHGILIISAFCGDGGELRQMSRDLREFERELIPRHFLIGVGIPQSMSTWEKLRLFLVRNPTKRQYAFSAWQVLPLGPDVISNSWDVLPDYLSKVEVMNDLSYPGLSDSDIDDLLIALGNVIEKSKNSLLPNTLGAQLELTPGFIFFDGLFEGKLEFIEQSVIMMTISSVLQAAREHKNKDICLSPSNYQSVVLAPENFLRFNDDILQACLLRASLPSELDYSSNNDLSNLMREFLFKVFTRHKHNFGYAALEFAAALATGKLKLRKEHTKNLVSSVLSMNPRDKGALAAFMLVTFNLLKES